MKIFLIAFCCCCLILSSNNALEVNTDRHWTEFKRAHSKLYNDESMEVIRRAIFDSNVKRIIEHNLDARHSFQMGVNQFADLTDSEFEKLILNARLSSPEFFRKLNTTKTFSEPINYKAPNFLDYRTAGYVTPVKNQGSCGSCWAFSTTGSLEGQHFRKHKRLISLSEQQLVDCSRPFKNFGCDGGFMDRAFDYIKENGGINSETNYPYKGKDGVCSYDPKKVAAKLRGWIDVQKGSEKQLKSACSMNGPISVAIDASKSSFRFYKSGVYNESKCLTDSLDHAVLVVGYGVEIGIDYWLVKNSWGTSWGDQGYIKMIRNFNNQCGIATLASFPLV